MTYPSNSETIAAAQLREYVERIEEEMIRAGNDAKRDVYAEAKLVGYDVKAMKIVLQKRRMNRGDRLVQEGIVQVYMEALGMVEEEAGDEADPSPASRAHAPARTRTREGEPEHDADGVITEPAAPDPSGVAADPPEGSDDSRASGEPDPVANVGEGANGAIAAASDDPASRETDDADRQQLAASGFTGDAAVASQAGQPDDAEEPVTEAPAAPIPTRPFNRQTHFKNSQGLPRLHGCQEPDTCAGSWRELCWSCRKIAEAA